MVDITTLKGVDFMSKRYKRKKVRLVNVVTPHETYDSKEVVSICENCPFPDCIDGWGKGCEHFIKEIKKIKESVT